MSLLSIENLCKTYGEKVLFDHISLTIAEKQRIGLIGVNGTGKSTLLKVMAGIDTAEEGSVLHAKQFHIEYLPQNPKFAQDLTVLEQIYDGDSQLMSVLRDYERALADLEADPENPGKQERLLAMQQKMDESNAWKANTIAKTILTRLGITDFNKPVKETSGGQQKRVAIAKALIQPADLLLLDEPTNHLDNETIEWLERYLAQYPGTLIVVTHDRYFLNRVTHRILELDNGQIYPYDGNYEVFLEKKAERVEKEIADERKHQNHLRRELAWLRRGARARSTKQKAHVDRVHQLQNQKSKIADEKMDVAIGSTRLGDQVLEMKNVTKAYSDQTLIDDFSYLVTPDERLGIIGPNGSGKTTLLNLLAGRTSPDAGTVEAGQTVKIGYYTQDQIEIDGDLRVIEYIKEAASAIRTADGQEITAEQMLERFLFSREMQRTYCSRLSGGERSRLYLLRTLMGEPNVLFLDEPTNDLDTQTLTILEDFLSQFSGVVVTVSHDRYFLDRVVDHLITFEGSGVIHRFEGNYSEYLEARDQEQARELSDRPLNAAKEPKKSFSKKERRRKLSYQEKTEWEEIEDRIDGLEQQIASIQEKVEQAGSDFEKVQELYQEQQKAEQALEQAMERWTELSLLVEEIEQDR